MKLEILSLRVSRRAIGAAILRPDGLVMSDGWHIPSAPSRAVAAVARSVERWLRPSVTTVVVDAPRRGVSATTDSILDTIAERLSSSGLHPMVLSKADMLGAYGVVALRTRAEVRELVVHYWPDLAGIRGRVQPYVMDAAAAALYGECQVTLSPPPA
jgi:hypothetical protein